MSHIGWIDFSSDERDKVKQVLAALNEPGTLDELGIGQIRDAFANRLFPGISTIQTRAKYFITVARLLRDIQQGKASQSKSPQGWLERQEHALAKSLVEVSEQGEPGIIGAESIERGGVSRRPSSIYWNGLKQLGIVHTPLSLHEFCDHLQDNSHIAHAANHGHQEGADDDDVDRIHRLIDLPDNIEEWHSEQNISIDLNLREAEFLVNKLQTAQAVADSVPAQILRLGGLSGLLQLCESSSAGTGDSTSIDIESLDFDIMTELLLNNPKVSTSCKQRLKQGHAFSLAMEGPHIAYNLSLARCNDLDDWAVTLQAEYTDWRQTVKERGLFHTGFIEDCFTELVGSRIHIRSRLFVERCCELQQRGGDLDELLALVERRARDNKGPRCLLTKKRDSDQWAGMRRLDYRWPNARQLLRDIEKGLQMAGDAADV